MPLNLPTVGRRASLSSAVEVALRQEVHEESGLTVASFSLFGAFSDPSMIAQYDLSSGERVIARVISLAFRVQVDDFSSLAVSAESTELRFFTHAELRTLDIAPTVRHIVDHYLEDRSVLVIE